MRRLILSAFVAAIAASPAAALLRAQPEPGFPEAVFIEPLPDGQSHGDCSGVVLAPTVVLTAAHCLSGKDFGPPHSLAARISVFDPGDASPRWFAASGFFRSATYAPPAARGMVDRCNCLAARAAAEDWGLLFVDQPLGIARARRIDEVLPQELRRRLRDTPLRLLGDATFSGDHRLALDLEEWLRATFSEDGHIDALVVGFGYESCRNETAALGCTGKGVRRSAPVRLSDDTRCSERRAGSGALPISVLCITATTGGRVPMTFADSGAPIFLRSRAGDWVLTGIVSVNTMVGGSGSRAHLALSLLFVVDELAAHLDPAQPHEPAAPFPAR